MKVSILIPAYNAEKYLRECLESVLGQTYKDIQVVVWNDGSTDNTLTIANEFANCDNRLEVYGSINQGVAVTRNNLLKKATGEYTLFVDADDWIEPDMISSLVEIIKTNDVDIAMCGHTSQVPQKLSVPDKSHDYIAIWEHSEILIKFLQHRELTGSLWNKLIKTDLFQEFNSGIPYGEDAMVMWQILLKVKRMAVTHNQHYHYRMNLESVSHSGGISKKMSVIPVWYSIINSIPDNNEQLVLLAQSRFGAEITLVLLQDSFKSSNNKENIQLLRVMLKNKLPYMRKSGQLSRKFLIFAYSVAYCWSLTKLIIPK